MQAYNLKPGLILTLDESDTTPVTTNGKSCMIKVAPVWKWVLQEEPL
jgi:predicted AAA+ superfamily ATPase